MKNRISGVIVFSVFLIACQEEKSSEPEFFFQTEEIKIDPELQSSFDETHPLCGDLDFNAVGVIACNSKNEILFDTHYKIGNGKFILVTNEDLEIEIQRSYNHYLATKSDDQLVFWCSIGGHFLDTLELQDEHERKKVFLHHVSLDGEDTLSIIERDSLERMGLEN